MQRAPVVELRYSVTAVPEKWVLLEDWVVPESVPHDVATMRFREVLDAWVIRCGRNVRTARSLAIRWLESNPRIGVDPDVCLLEPPPPDLANLSSIRLWVTGHEPRRFVSRS